MSRIQTNMLHQFEFSHPFFTIVFQNPNLGIIYFISCHIQVISNHILQDFSCRFQIFMTPSISKEFQASFLTLATLSDIFTHPCARSPNCICRLSFHMMFRLCRAYSHLQGVHGSATRCSHGLHLSCHEEK